MTSRSYGLFPAGKSPSGWIRRRVFARPRTPYGPLDSAPLEDDWKGVPLALMAPAVGTFREVAKKLPFISKLDLRVCLPASSANVRDARILSSVGVPCTIMIEGPDTDWDALSDLMAYSLFGRVPHAPIGPFDYIAGHYGDASYPRWCAAFFEDPRQFFHLDHKKNVALSRAELLAERFIGSLDDVEETGSPEIEKRTEAWKQVFTENSVCAACAGFKLCLGSFVPKNGEARGCSAFFTEMVESLEELRSMRENVTAEQRTWRL
jgi:hypothetical protein